MMPLQLELRKEEPFSDYYLNFELPNMLQYPIERLLEEQTSEWGQGKRMITYLCS